MKCTWHGAKVTAVRDKSLKKLKMENNLIFRQSCSQKQILAAGSFCWKAFKLFSKHNVQK